MLTAHRLQPQGSSMALHLPPSLPRMALRMDMVAMGTRSAKAKNQVSLFLGKIKSTLANQVDLESWLFQLDHVIIILHKCNEKNLPVQGVNKTAFRTSRPPCML